MQRSHSLPVMPNINIDEEWHEECILAEAWGQQPPNRGAVEAGVISTMLIVVYCDNHGHDLEDDGSYANAESGADLLRCKRCGCSWSHTYY